MKPLKIWSGQIPERLISLKIDGIQAQLRDGVVLSRAGKPLHNIQPRLLRPDRLYEVFCGSFSSTQSIVRTIDASVVRPVEESEIYEIWPGVDERLVLPFMPHNVGSLFHQAIRDGHEGLVIDHTFKMKPTRTYDVPVTGIIPGRGKHEGRMGALQTPMGKVGTGFTDEMRAYPWAIGDLIEVGCMEVTPDGKFRHPRFMRLRWDKA